MKKLTLLLALTTVSCVYWTPASRNVRSSNRGNSLMTETRVIL